jgi:hypothetical protein
MSLTSLLMSESSMTETQRLQVGSIDLARRKTGVCDVGEIGVCYEVYTLDGRPGYSFIFQSGRYDGFSPDDVAVFLMVTEETCPAIADYDFHNVMRLSCDFEQGRFDAAFSRGRDENTDPGNQ